MCDGVEEEEKESKDHHAHAEGVMRRYFVSDAKARRWRSKRTAGIIN
jgi:hypothetical protein